ncbi:G-protein coupled receptor Mth2 [Amyelois transitella]|uniref:G-protein coupled receptor Mth2 n=1 Tax=Amyelois transitella TaxID=680683 RepID=UPI00298FA873|nr:G-protein coupled receptor Mth2 [Amyelois transitella]
MGCKLFVFMTNLLVISLVSCNPCSRQQSINITSGDLQDGNSILHGGLVYKTGQWYEVEEDGIVSRFGCPCLESNRVCIRKCCNPRHMYLGYTCKEPPEESLLVFNPKVHKGKDLLNVTASLHFFYLHGLQCDKYLVDPSVDPEVLYIQENGTLLEYSQINDTAQWVAPSEYCVDMMTDDRDSIRMIALICYQNTNHADDSPALYISYAVGLLLSVLFFLATFMVYAFIPELRNLHGMCLMAYCAGLIVAYICLAYLKMHFGEDGEDTMTGCIVIAFIVYYSFQTSFFWLNVMCFDIWRTFSGYRGSTSTKKREMRRFAVYGVYAWGMPALLTACTLSMQYAKLPYWVIKPGFGDRKCWFSNWLSELVYFYPSVLALVICNLVLFTITAHRIRSIRQETAILKGSKSTSKLKQDKQRYSLYLKLFIVMGINWTVELVSFAVGGSNWYWVLLDISNIMLGFFIFIIFVWKKKVRNLARRRYRSIRGLPPITSEFRKSTNVTSTAVTEESRLSSDDAHVRLKDMN